MTQDAPTSTPPATIRKPRPEFIDGVSLEGDEPGFEQHKERERILQRLLVEMIFGSNRIDEQRPAILRD